MQAALGSNATANVSVLFSGAIDQNNTVKKNTMLDPGPFVVTLAQTPITTHTTGTLKRNDSISISLTENITGVNSGAFAGTNLGGFSVTIGDVANTVNVSPLPGRDLGANNTSLTLTVQPGGFFNSDGYPNVTTNVIDLTFAPDTTAPVLQQVHLKVATSSLMLLMF